MLSKIEKIKINIPQNCLLQIANTLITNKHWCFAADDHSMSQQNFTENFFNNKIQDRGFYYQTFVKNRENITNNNLNFWASLIFEMIKEKSVLYKLHEIERIFWNFYHPNSNSNLHVDNSNPNFTSIVYNLHTNTGGTLFQNSKGETQIIKSEQNEAIIFPSNILHKGLPPKTDACRFSLNIIVI